MKRSTVSIVVARLLSTLLLTLLLTLVCGGCRSREKSVAGEAASQTIEPAKPQPDATDTATLTQTVDVEAGRSEVEGRTANGAEITSSSDTVTTAPAKATTTAKPAPPSATTTTR